MTGNWRNYTIAADLSHHISGGFPAYPARFHEVLKFHEPGLAPVLDSAGACHITPDGLPAYSQRYLRAFGFYEGRAAVQASEGWFHILADGRPLYGERYAWCGNFQEGRCPVRDSSGNYFHLNAEGGAAYRRRYRYAGDFRDGFAVVQREDGRHTHVDANGTALHGKWFLDLDVFHKNFARARDEQGWHHVDVQGRQLYGRRFRNVEPFYNGQARAEEPDGALSVIDESGHTVLNLSKPSKSPLQALSEDMVGLWKTHTIRAAVELGVFELLPATPLALERQCGLAPGMGRRLLRALAELGLARQDSDGQYCSTARGAYLKQDHFQTLSDAAMHWGRSAGEAWQGLTGALRSGKSSWSRKHGQTFFDSIQERPVELEGYHRAMASYARHDYAEISRALDFGAHRAILDAGGGTGELSFSLLRSCPNLSCTVMDLPEVVARVAIPTDLADRCAAVGGNLFKPWPVQAEAVILARVLHDWPDEAAARILARARQAMPGGGTLYIVELIPDDLSAKGGLLDLNMLVMTGGAERTAEEYGSLLSGAGFKPVDVTPTAAVSSIVRAQAA